MLFGHYGHSQDTRTLGMVKAIVDSVDKLKLKEVFVFRATDDSLLIIMTHNTFVNDVIISWKVYIVL